MKSSHNKKNIIICDEYSDIISKLLFWLEIIPLTWYFEIIIIIEWFINYASVDASGQSI